MGFTDFDCLFKSRYNITMRKIEGKAKSADTSVVDNCIRPFGKIFSKNTVQMIYITQIKQHCFISPYPLGH